MIQPTKAELVAELERLKSALQELRQRAGKSMVSATHYQALQQERSRYKQALQDILDYCPYHMAKEVARSALNLEREYRTMTPPVPLAVELVDEH